MAITSAVMIVVKTQECRYDKNDKGKKKRMFVELTRKWFQGGDLMPVIKGVPRCASQMKNEEAQNVHCTFSSKAAHRALLCDGSLQYPIILIGNNLLNGLFRYEICLWCML